MVDPSSSFSSPPFSPPLPSPPHPPPPSPILQGPTPIRRRSSRRAVFEIASASPQTFTSEEQTTLKKRLELSRRRKISVKPGVPARLLSGREMEESSSSGAERDQKEIGTARNDGTDKSKLGRGSDSSSSPWVTDSETPSQQVVPDMLAERRKKSSGGHQYGKRGAGKPRGGAIRIEGFDIPAEQQASTPPTSPSSPGTPRRPALCSTSSLSRLFAHATPSIETTPLEPSEPPPSDLPLPQPVTTNPGATWNTDIFGAALAAENRSIITSASPEASTVDHRGRSRSTTVSSSSTLPRSETSLSTSSSRSTLAAASKRPHFLSPSPSIVSTPSHSPPRSLILPTDEKDLNLQFIRRPGFTRQGSAGENLSRMCSGRGEKDIKIPGSSASTTKGNSETEATDTEVEHSESEESELSSIFQPSVFASNYSNSATTLSSASSSKPRIIGSTSSEPSFTSARHHVASVLNASSPQIFQAPESSQRGTSEPKKVDLQSLRRQQLERKQDASRGNSDSTPRRQRGIDLASPPWEFKSFGKFFSRNR